MITDCVRPLIHISNMRHIETATLETEAAEERLQLRRYHELGYLANQYRKLKRDIDVEEMSDRLALLEGNLEAP